MNVFTYMSLGGGVQSGTMAEMIAEGHLSAPDAVIFADTGNEPSYVYEYIDYLKGRLATVDVPLYVVSGGDLVHDMEIARYRFAPIPAYTTGTNGKIGQMKRQCTNNYKITPIERQVRRLLVERGFARVGPKGRIRVPTKSVSVKAWLGISMDEVVRMKPSRMVWITNVWPLIDMRMSRSDCVAWLKDRSLPIPKKSACLICPFHDQSYWKELKRTRPDDWAAVVDFDNSLRDERAERFNATGSGDMFLYGKAIPLHMARFNEKGEGEGETESDVCDEGYCFV